MAIETMDISTWESAWGSEQAAGLWLRLYINLTLKLDVPDMQIVSGVNVASGG